MTIAKNWKKLLLSLQLLLCVVTTGCNNDLNQKYANYYNLGTPEVYCWKIDNDWFCGALVATDRLKTTSEIQWLQDNLPCSLNDMKKILRTYSDQDKYATFVCIVSVPPKIEEITHDNQLVYDNIDTYEWLFKKLGLEFRFE